MPQPSILLVEDEEALTKALQYSLQKEGFTVYTAADGLKGLVMAKEKRPDLVLLDLMLPEMNGLEVCRRLRKETTSPIVMLTAKAEEVDKIVGLELGADDYVTKPFSFRELLARVKAQLRRVDMDKTKDDEGSHTDAVLAGAGLTMDIGQRIAKREGVTFQLRPKEFELLAFFLKNPRIVFSRETLLERVWGYDFVGDTRTVDVHVRWLREKIEDEPGSPRRLLTVRGVGYKLEA